MSTRGIPVIGVPSELDDPVISAYRSVRGFSVFAKSENDRMDVTHMRQQTLRPVDLVVALRLAKVPDERYESVADVLSISLSTAHQAVRRLTAAGLVTPGTRKVNRRALLEFISHGARYAFFANPGAQSRGVPTAHSAPPLRDEIASDEGYVWPAVRGKSRGASVTPLYEGAISLQQRAPDLYQALALVDAVRVGRVRERKLALEHLERFLKPAE